MEFFVEDYFRASTGDISGQTQELEHMEAAVFAAVQNKDNLLFKYLLTHDCPTFPSLDLKLHDLASSAYAEYRDIIHTAFRFKKVEMAATQLLDLAEKNGDSELLELAQAEGIVRDPR